jgi:hypothetical protein
MSTIMNSALGVESCEKSTHWDVCCEKSSNRLDINSFYITNQIDSKHIFAHFIEQDQVTT